MTILTPTTIHLQHLAAIPFPFHLLFFEELFLFVIQMIQMFLAFSHLCRKTRHCAESANLVTWSKLPQRQHQFDVQTNELRGSESLKLGVQTTKLQGLPSDKVPKRELQMPKVAWKCSCKLCQMVVAESRRSQFRWAKGILSMRVFTDQRGHANG